MTEYLRSKYSLQKYLETVNDIQENVIAVSTVTAE